MALKQKSPYNYDQRKYFDWAKGIRATDRYHAVAQRYFERIKGLEARGKHDLIAKMGLELAEDTRIKVARMLKCDPKNIYFSNSASCAELTAIFGMIATSSLSRIEFLFDENLNQYPTTSVPLAMLKGNTMDKIITRQNYGYRSIPLPILKCYFKQILHKGGWKNSPFLMPSDPFEGLPVSKFIYRQSGIKDRVEIMLSEHMDRKSGFVMPICPNDKPHKSLYLRFMDGSHGFGISPAEMSVDHDMYFSGSSKALGAEPTIGVAYASDYIIDKIIESQKRNLIPRIAFQFSPYLTGPVNTREIAANPFWISLPELKSMNAALTDILEIGIGGIKSQLAVPYRVLVSLLNKEVPLGSLDESHLYTKDMLNYSTRALFLRNDCNEINDEYFSERFLAPNFLPWYILLKENVDLDSVRIALRSEFCVSNFSDTPSIFGMFGSKDSLEHIELGRKHMISLRISLRHDVDQDIGGFVAALKRIYEQYGRK